MGLSYILLYYRHNIKIVKTNKTRCQRDQDSPSLCSSPLSWPTSLGPRRARKLSRPEVVKRLWAHIKTNKLQDPENKQYFVPDTKMQPIFGKEKIRAFGMAKFLKTHLTNPDK